MENTATVPAHTAGPWEIFGMSTAAPEVRAVTGNMAGKQIAIVGNETEGTEERVANARLIAAAPDLLEACKSVFFYQEDISPKLRPILKAAIAKTENTAAAATSPALACLICDGEWDGHGSVCESCYENAGDYLVENADLIAAASDLYKCARYLRLVCEDRLSIEAETNNDPEVIQHYQLLLADANAAIAKSEGES